MKKYEETILNVLIDQYERSKSFIGENERRQSFQKKAAELFPGYDDSANYLLFTEVNEQVRQLEQSGLIVVKRLKRGRLDTEIVDTVRLEDTAIRECYRCLKRKPKAELNHEIAALLQQYQDKSPLLERFCKEQLERLAKNKKVQYYDGQDKLQQILKVLEKIELVEEETYIRNFSANVLGDSKAFERIKSQVVSILFEYGDYPSKETLLEDLNIIKNPGFVYLMGNAAITISGETINLNKFKGPLGLSSEMIEEIEAVQVNASKVITIENLTTFHSYKDEDAFIIYLGGYHNRIRRSMISRIYRNNPQLEYYHYGDIDAGGFYILLDLRKKTGIQFKPLNMDVHTLLRYEKYVKPLTENDRARLSKLQNSEFSETVLYMLAHNCKLEQEAVQGN